MTQEQPNLKKLVELPELTRDILFYNLKTGNPLATVSAIDLLPEDYKADLSQEERNTLESLYKACIGRIIGESK